jgi:hypothetical protein
MGGQHDISSMDYDNSDDGNHYIVHPLFFLEGADDPSQVGE